MLGQLAERAAGDSDETLASAVLTGRRALAEWQDLADALRKLEAEYERLTLSESRALARLQHVLDLLDKFVEPSRSASAAIRPGETALSDLIPSPRLNRASPGPDDHLGWALRAQQPGRGPGVQLRCGRCRPGL